MTWRAVSARPCRIPVRAGHGGSGLLRRLLRRLPLLLLEGVLRGYLVSTKRVSRKYRWGIERVVMGY